MQFAPGTQLGSYEILSPLGAGGMGEVYRARDTRLGREVAIKVLPQHLASNPEVRVRFEREASAVAALKHPNIVTIHAIEESEGVHFIVMELVEGKSLADIIASGPLSLDQFLEIAVPLSDAVASAHAKGIIHRDLKPGNVLIDADGRVKVLDFGLAKLATQAISDSDQTLAATSHTRDGQILGTVAYMSPEQAEGLPLDHRSDIFSLGIVFYEMASGTNPFQRATVVSTLSAILKDIPTPIGDLRPLPSSLDDIVSRCLEKDVAIRYQTAAQVRDELAGLRAATTAERAPRAKSFSAMDLLRKPYLAVPLAALVVAAIALGVSQQKRSHKMRWARQVALPEIERAIDATPWTGGVGFWRAFNLENEAKRYLPDDPVLLALYDRTVSPLTIRTDPPGALVYARPYAGADTTWTLVGKTPIDSLRFVRGVFRVRIEKHGYQTTDDLFWNGFYDEKNRTYALKQPDQIPRGMTWVSGQSPRVESNGETEGVHLPGVEHLPPQELGGFFVDRYEVTNKAYKVFVDGGGYTDPTFWKQPFVEAEKTVEWKDAIARFVDKTQRPGPAGWEVGDYPDGTEHHPVTGISWYEAAAFAEFAGKNLPTIYHWDRVALTWASGDIVPLSNLTTNGLVRVGSTKGMNRFGAYDLAGNAREWCANAPSRGDRFILGGGWNDPPYGFNDAYAQSPWDRSETNGFRCIRYVGTADPASLEATVDVPFRDFMSEPAPSDTMFAMYANLYRYDPKPLNAVVESKLETDDYVREKVVIDAAYGGERMALYLFIPKKSTPPYQAVVLFPGSGSLHTRSSAGLTPAPQTSVVKSGRVLVWPVLKSTYERGDEQDSDYADESNRYKDHVVMWTKDIMRSVDYLETRKDIDSSRLAFLGHSWGAAMAPIVLAVEPRFKVAVLGVAGLLFQRSQPEADPMQYIRRVQVPVIMINGKYDFFFPYETSQVPFYQLLGTPADHKKLVVHEFGHAVPPADRARETLAWLDKYLGAVR